MGHSGRAVVLVRDGSVVNLPTWRKSAPLNLSSELTVEDALVAAAENGLGHLAVNEECVLARSHEEGVHQMRVALRRLRSRAALYKQAIPPRQFARLEAELKWLLSALGPARDWDVFCLEILPPARTALPDEPELDLLSREAEKKRNRGYQRAQSALRSRRYAHMKRWLARWAETRRWRTDPSWLTEAGTMSAPVRDFAGEVLESRHAKVLQRGEHLQAMRAEERHKLRIQIKRLRYAAEFFTSLYGNNAVKPYVGNLKDLQDSLGSLNDLSVARSLMADLASKGSVRKRLRLAYASGLVIGASPLHAAQAAPLKTTWERFAATEPFW